MNPRGTMTAMRERLAWLEKNGRRAAPSAYRVSAADDVAEILLYDAIGVFGITAEDFVRDLDRVEAGTIHLRINSPGGDVFDGMAIHNALQRHAARIEVYVDGLAASMGSVIAMAGETIHMSAGSFMMIHDPWSVVIGSAEDMRKEADVLDKVGQSLAGIYAGVSGRSAADVADLMAAETWFTASEAVSAGLATSFDGEGSADDPQDAFDLTIFDNVPAALRDAAPADTSARWERQTERALRDAGASRRESEAAIAAIKSTRQGDPADNPAASAALDQVIAQIRAA